MLNERLNLLKAVWFPELPQTDKLAFDKNMIHTNLSRERILCVLMIATFLILMGIDYVIGRTHPELNGLYIGAILYRAFLVLILIVFLIVPGHDTASDEIRGWHRFLDCGFVMITLIWTSSMTGALQLVRIGIEPYIIPILIAAAFIFQGGLRSAVTLGVSLFTLTAGLLHFQTNVHVLIAQLVNGTIFTIFAFVISRVVFALRMREFVNAKLIKDQKLALEEANLRLAESNEMLKRLTALDPLTGISNRRFFEKALRVEWKRQARAGRPLSVIMIDVDRFKSFNDSYGHQAGDECLKLVAETLRDSLKRPSDLVARYGGEEFVVLLPQTDRRGAHHVARRIMDAIIALNIRHVGSPLGQLSVSTGVGTCMPGKDFRHDALIREADEALYGCKAISRNEG